MTMKRTARSMPAGRFKSKCLSVLDEVAASKREVLITKRGKPVARVVPVEAQRDEAPLDGLIEYQGDLVSPIDSAWTGPR